MEFLDDGCLVSGSEDGEINIWNLIKGKLLRLMIDNVAVCSIATLGNVRFVYLSRICKFWK